MMKFTTFLMVSFLCSCKASFITGQNIAVDGGRSLGLNYRQTMFSIIIPQAVKNILPALCNEFISLLKETSIAGYIGLVDLTKAGDIIRSSTYEAYIPLITVALIYLAIVIILTTGINYMERSLRKNER